MFSAVFGSKIRPNKCDNPILAQLHLWKGAAMQLAPNPYCALPLFWESMSYIGSSHYPHIDIVLKSIINKEGKTLVYMDALLNDSPKTYRYLQDYSLAELFRRSDIAYVHMQEALQMKAENLLFQLEKRNVSRWDFLACIDTFFPRVAEKSLWIR